MRQFILDQLIQPESAILEGRAYPDGFYQILAGAAPLAGCAFPFGFKAWEKLHDAGYRHVVCLASELPRYDCFPLNQSIAVDLCDLCDGGEPDEPEWEEKIIGWIGRSIVRWLERGEGVLVHCAAGRGRTGCVVGVVLYQLGMPVEDIIEYLRKLHGLRSGKGWPESLWQSDVIERGS